MNTDFFIGENIKKDYFGSNFIGQLSRTGEGVHSKGGKITVYLPVKLGVCHGVVRAIRMAMHAVEKYPNRRIFLLNDMIHNPFINKELQKLGVIFIDGKYRTEPIQIPGLKPEDVVIIPAFGAPPKVYHELEQAGCTVIDTTCGEVLSVWKRIQKYNTTDFTTVVFGKYAHEETIATSSRAKKYLILKDLRETAIIADFIKDQSPEKSRMISEYFQKAYSPGFEPDVDLITVGMASQTTMYAKEFIQASDLIQSAFVARYGQEQIGEHFLELDTICSATQERQDALQFLLPLVDAMIVVGGYNSSNTINLARIAKEHGPTFHIDGPGKVSPLEIRHQPIGEIKEVVESNGLLANGHINIGVASGASTVDAILEQVVYEILNLDGGMVP